VRNLTGESGLYLHYRALSPVAATLPEKLGASDLAERLKAAAADAGNTKVDPKFLEIDWTKAAEGGNAENGRKLYSANGLGCAKCHAATADATLNAGPSLADAKKRFTTAYLVESVLLPTKQVSPVFKATLIQTKDGKTYTGLVVGETGEKLEMILTDATKQTFAKSDIEDRKLQDLSPMPAGLVKTPEELRDILAYLLGETVKAP
jgi:putative heme-binding domain-containing protein